ncbi:VanZ family protein [Romboutsia maritimum]|uniref:VanZ family protein n=1 Tax=Romboutsia maritimum TaxID=2020948 RepID=A0A371ITW2_9FIRM|nr:VanZ family protein [Romboutsia maritimum]RDY23920.1 VanZ family protein [Romboutsia maritimum]
MKTYLLPIGVSAFIFPFLAFLSIVPYIIYTYKKHGNVSRFKTFILYTFAFYMLTAFFLTMLPLPTVDKPRGINISYTQLIPFNFINDILKETNIELSKPQTYLYLVRERAFLQVFFNALLLLPLGVYLRYLFKKDLKKTILICFLVSLFFEITQRTGIYGIYKYPYRLFDVDDLMLNTFGGFIGFYVAPLFKFILPDISDKDDIPVVYGNLASYPKRIFAFLLDLIMFEFLFNVNNTSILFFIISSFIYFMLIPYITNGITFGNFVLGLRLKGSEEKLDLKSLVKRYSILIYGVFGVNRFLNVITNNLASIEKYDFMLFFFAIQIIFDIICLIHLISHIIKKDKALIYDKISNINIVNIR